MTQTEERSNRAVCEAQDYFLRQGREDVPVEAGPDVSRQILDDAPGGRRVGRLVRTIHRTAIGSFAINVSQKNGAFRPRDRDVRAGR